jgi:hypothetical protein
MLWGSLARWGPARNICAFPQCRQSFTQVQVDRQDPRILPTIVGEEAHIYWQVEMARVTTRSIPSPNLRPTKNRVLRCGIQHTYIDSCGGRATTPRHARRFVEMQPDQCGFHIHLLTDSTRGARNIAVGYLGGDVAGVDEWFAVDLSSVQWLSNGAPVTTIHFCRELRTSPRSS